MGRGADKPRGERVAGFAALTLGVVVGRTL